MTSRYNPQSTEKQVRGWPVLFSKKSLEEDMLFRLRQQLETTEQGWADPFSPNLPLDEELIIEYGIDACRLAITRMPPSNKTHPSDLLESSFKWLSKLYDSISKQPKPFNPVPWLKAIATAEDHISNRDKAYQALALVMKAFKEEPPNSGLSGREWRLVSAALFPFAPIFATAILNKSPKALSYKKILKEFEEYICVKAALEKGGWHWLVFSRRMFEEDPIKELMQIRWIAKASSGSIVRLLKADGGIRICFS